MDDRKLEEKVQEVANSQEARQLRWQIELAMANYRIFLEDQVGRECHISIVPKDACASSDNIVLWHEIKKALN